jgi:CheY-like chemotaxis protein
MAVVLLVDDDESMRAIMQAMLRRLGHEVAVATNGNEALRLFRERTFDLVITDLIMPEREGLDTIRELRREGNVKIIAMSGGGRTSPATYLQIAKQIGASAILSKPFSHEDLKAAIDSADIPDRRDL